MIRALAAGFGLLVVMAAAAQTAPDWLRDMPSVQAVQQQIQGADTAQTLGRQCAALTRLERGADMPAAFRFNPTPQMAALAESYRAGIGDLRRRFNDTVKPLTDAENQREWERMCGNRRSGIHPLTGEADSNFPALDEPLREAEFAALLGPAARAAYENEQQARAQRAAATDQQREIAQAASERRDGEALRRHALTLALLVTLPALGVAMIVWMLRSLARIQWQPGPRAGEVQLGSAIWSIQPSGGLVQACNRHMQTVVDETRVRNESGPDTVHRSLREIIHWEIRYVDADGKPHDLKLRNWDISVQPGDVLHAYSLRRKNKDSDLVLIANRTTGKSWHNVAFVHGRLVPVAGPVALALVIISGFLTAGLGWLIGLWWMRRAMKKATSKAAEVLRWIEEQPSRPA